MASSMLGFLFIVGAGALIWYMASSHYWFEKKDEWDDEWGR